MQAPRRRQPDPVRLEEGRLIMDFLWIAFTFAVAIIFGKFLLTNTAEEIVDFFENNKNQFSVALASVCMMAILMYASYFYYRKRYEILVDLALDYLSAGQNNVLRFRNSFSWLRAVLAVIQPPPRYCMYVHEAFKYFFQFCLLLLAAVIGAFLCTGREIEFLSMNVVCLGIYYAVAFSYDGHSVERVTTHLSYTLMHAGALISHFDYDVISYGCINAGFAGFVLCALWYFVDVPTRRETNRQRRSP